MKKFEILYEYMTKCDTEIVTEQMPFEKWCQYTSLTLLTLPTCIKAQTNANRSLKPRKQRFIRGSGTLSRVTGKLVPKDLGTHRIPYGFVRVDYIGEISLIMVAEGIGLCSLLIGWGQGRE